MKFSLLFVFYDVTYVIGIVKIFRQ